MSSFSLTFTWIIRDINMAEISIREAINKTLHQEMARDQSVIVIGEDVASKHSGGVYGVTLGLSDKFGSERVIDTPITESAIIGAAGGAAAARARLRSRGRRTTWRR